MPWRDSRQVDGRLAAQPNRRSLLLRAAGPGGLFRSRTHQRERLVQRQKQRRVAVGSYPPGLAVLGTARPGQRLPMRPCCLFRGRRLAGSPAARGSTWMSGLSGPNDRIHKHSPPWSPSPLHACPQEAPDLCIDPLTFTYHGCPHFSPNLPLPRAARIPIDTEATVHKPHQNRPECRFNVAKIGDTARKNACATSAASIFMLRSRLRMTSVAGTSPWPSRGLDRTLSGAALLASCLARIFPSRRLNRSIPSPGV